MAAWYCALLQSCRPPRKPLAVPCRLRCPRSVEAQLRPARALQPRSPAALAGHWLDLNTRGAAQHAISSSGLRGALQYFEYGCGTLPLPLALLTLPSLVFPCPGAVELLPAFLVAVRHRHASDDDAE